MTTMTTSDETCPVQVSNRERFATFHPCGRKVVRDGLCGLHAAAADRARAKRAERQARTAASANRQAQAEDACHVLATAYGIAARPHYQPGYGSQSGHYTGGITLSADSTAALIARLKEER